MSDEKNLVPQTYPMEGPIFQWVNGGFYLNGDAGDKFHFSGYSAGAYLYMEDTGPVWLDREGNPIPALEPLHGPHLPTSVDQYRWLLIQIKDRLNTDEFEVFAELLEAGVSWDNHVCEW